MTSLRSLLRRGDSGALSPLARRIAVVIAVLTPLLIAGVAVTALNGGDGASAASAPATPTPSPSASPTSSASPVSDSGAADSDAPLLPAAVVNEDVIVTTDAADGTKTITAVGKVLVSELTGGSAGQGFSWTVTDSDTASAGLTSGQYAAVVTIPSDFSADFLTLTTDSPQQAQVQVQTNGANSYATGVLATALSTDLQGELANAFTTNYITGTLQGYATLHQQLGQAADGANTLAGLIQQTSTGAGEIASGLTKTVDEVAIPTDTGAKGLAVGLNAIVTATSDLPAYANGFAEASSGITAGIGLVKDRVASEAAASYDIDARQQALEASIAALSAEVPTLTPEEIQSRLADIQLDAAGIRVSTYTVTLGLGLDSLGITALQDLSALLSGAQAEFAADIPELTDNLALAAKGADDLTVGTGALVTILQPTATATGDLANGLGQLAGKTGELGSGLATAAATIPDYTADQQEAIADAVTEPIVTDQSDVNALPTPAAAIAAVAVPLALWLGAFAIYLLLVPFSRRALDSTASTFRVVIGALAPAALLAVIQAAVVAVVLFLAGANPSNITGCILFSALMSLAFVTLHQGLVALLGQAGRLLSLALVVVQVAAAAVIIPNGLSSPFYTGLSTVLPLSHAITGMHALIGGESLVVVGQEAAVLVVFGLIGLALSLIAATRRRSRNVIVVHPAPRAVEASATTRQAAIAG